LGALAEINKEAVHVTLLKGIIQSSHLTKMNYKKMMMIISRLEDSKRLFKALQNKLLFWTTPTLSSLLCSRNSSWHTEGKLLQIFTDTVLLR